MNNEHKALTASEESFESVIPFTYTNDYDKLIRITAIVLKFIRFKVYCKVSNQTKERLNRTLELGRLNQCQRIVAEDYEIAERLVIRHHYYKAQNVLNRYVNDRNLKLILDEKGIYREATRMKNSSLSSNAKNPILLLPNQALTQMVIMKYHRKTFHAGTAHTVVAVREKYLVPNLRQLTKSILKQCVVCRRVQGQAYRYPFVPDLPSERVTRNRPFQNIGLDYFGPLIIRSERNDKKKIWVCLFTCMVTRAVHLETVLDNSTIEFLSAFRRFIARRGAPDLVISDNAPTFKLGSEVLQNELPKQERNPNLDSIRIRENIKWKFITPFSPWQGGFYERLVGSVKNALKKATGKAILTLRNFETVLTEVEAVLNTRPLTPVNDSLIDGTIKVLRPVDLLNPFSNIHPFTGTDVQRTPLIFYSSETKESITHWFHSINENLNEFWNIWHKDYLQALIEKFQRMQQSRHGSVDT
ncbi:integrase core domain protein, partial [Oesophagostomum dentatum]